MRWPPDSSDGSRFSNPSSPTRPSDSAMRSWISFSDIPPFCRSPMATLSPMVMESNRAANWKT